MPATPNIIHLDYETYSACDLKACGGWRYAADHTTEILMIGLALNDEEPVVWLPSFSGKQRMEFWYILYLLSQPETLVYAHNATGFEIPITKYLFEKTTGFKPPANHQWRCTAAMARKAAMPASLEKLAEFLGMEQEKDTRGKALIRKFCIPQVATKTQLAKGKVVAPRVLPPDDPAAFAEFIEYCRQDVRVERDIAHKMVDFELSGASLQTFQLDIAINERGLPVNLDGLVKAKVLVDEVTTRVAGEFRAITGFEHTQGKLFLPWLKERGYAGANLTADTIEEALENEDPEVWGSLNGEAAAALKLKQQIGYASIKKLPAMVACAGPHDNRVRGTLVYHGATTGRWTARLIQPQNFKRPTISNSEDAYADICAGRGVEYLEVMYGPVLEVLSSCVRHFIHDTEPEDFSDCMRPQYPVERPMLDADFSAIEGRIVCWLAGQEDALQEYRDKLDRYKVMAAIIFAVRHDAVTKDQRFVGKQAVLGCGYGMGPDKFRATCEKLGFDGLEAGVEHTAVEAFRKKHNKIRELWYSLERMAKSSIRQVGTLVHCGKLKLITMEAAGMLCLFIQLPSRRKLCYPLPEIVADGDRERITFWGQRPNTVMWGRVDTYGGKLVENCVQGIAADIMAHGAIQAERKGYEIAGLIHDEALAYYTPERGQTLEEFVSLLTTLPSWAGGLPLEAEGAVVPFYTK